MYRLQKGIWHNSSNDRMSDMLKISKQVINFITRVMENCTVEQAAGEQTLADVKI